MTHPVRVEGEPSMMVDFLDLGVDFIHLRKPHLEEKPLEKLIHAIPEKYRNRVILHGKLLLAEKYSLAGVHYSPDNPATKDSLRSRLPKSIFALHPEDLSMIDARYSRIFLGPVFTQSHHRCSINWPWFDCPHQRFMDIKPATARCIAAGGVDLHNMEQTITWGFDGMLLYTAIWEALESTGYLNTLNYVEQICTQLSRSAEALKDASEQEHR